MTALVIAWVWVVLAIGVAGIIASEKGWKEADGVLVYAMLSMTVGPVLILLILATVDVLTGSDIVL